MHLQAERGNEARRGQGQEEPQLQQERARASAAVPRAGSSRTAAADTSFYEVPASKVQRTDVPDGRDESMGQAPSELARGKTDDESPEVGDEGRAHNEGRCEGSDGSIMSARVTHLLNHPTRA